MRVCVLRGSVPSFLLLVLLLLRAYMFKFGALGWQMAELRGGPGAPSWL